jgi:hypothetical protein
VRTERPAGILAGEDGGREEVSIQGAPDHPGSSCR